MSQLVYHTRGNSTPHGKPRVYFCCHPADQKAFLDSIVKEILSYADCSVWYAPEGGCPLFSQRMGRAGGCSVPNAAFRITGDCPAAHQSLPCFGAGVSLCRGAAYPSTAHPAGAGAGSAL